MYRPDADAYLTWLEAKMWARMIYQSNRDLYVDLSKIDFSKVKRQDFGSEEILEVKLAGKHFSNLNDALVHGSLWLQIDEVGYATIHSNTSFRFDFDWNQGDSFIRNIATKALEMSIIGIPSPIRINIMHSYKPYNIYYYGRVFIGN